MNKPTQMAKLGDRKKSNWSSEGQVWYNFIPYLAKSLSMLSKFRHRWGEHSGQTKAAIHKIELS